MKNQSTTRARRLPVVTEEPLLGGDQHDYADAFEVQLSGQDQRTAEQFTRCAFEQASSPVRQTIAIAFRLIGFQLGPATSPDHVAGWRILTSQPDVLHLEAVSALLRGVMVMRRVEPGRMVISTYLFYSRPVPAGVLWAMISPVHRRVAAYLMERAVAANDRAESPADPPHRFR
jgi:hypothetical protein